MTLQVITANRLSDGVVVFRTAGGRWSARVEDAGVLDAGAAEAALAAGQADAVRPVVVGVYLVDVVPGRSGPVPVEFRERIRAQGPSVGVRGAFEVAAPALPGRAIQDEV
ncbi:hypothetical protein STVA_18710 [Allostella vacuolata]|nr:hypothetical protein STVA_18710 [Stella vacuolata]